MGATMERVRGPSMWLGLYKRLLRYQAALSRTDTLEAVSASIALLWAVCLLAGITRFNPGGATSQMAAVAPEWVWSLVFLSGGGLQLVAMTNGSNVSRFITAMFAFFSWAFIALLFIQFQPVAVSTPVYLVLAATQFLSALSIAVEPGKVDTSKPI